MLVTQKDLIRQPYDDGVSMAVMFDNFTVASPNITTKYQAFNNGAAKVDDYSATAYMVFMNTDASLAFNAPKQTNTRVELIVTGGFDGQIWIADQVSQYVSDKGLSADQWEPNFQLSSLMNIYNTNFGTGAGQADDVIENFTPSQISTIYITGASVIDGVS